MDVRQLFLDTLEKYEMIHRSDAVVVGVSGGADSLCLLHLLTTLSGEMDLKLFVAHLDHMFRGEASREDAEFVERLCSDWDIPYFGGKRDVPKMIEDTGLSPEDAARRARYAFFDDVASKVGASVIATGHNRDDQEETILMNILRGTGPKGLMGIPPHRPPFIRPLVEISRNSIEEYIGRLGLQPRIDATNLIPDYFRNRLRLELIPYIKDRFCPQLGKSLTRLSEITRVEQDYLGQAEESVWGKVARGDSEGINIDVSRFDGLHIALKHRILRRALKAVVGDIKDFEYRHILMLENFIAEGDAGSEIQLPRGVRGNRGYGEITFTVGQSTRIPEFQYPLTVPGKTHIAELGLFVCAQIRHNASETITANPLIAQLDYDKIKTTLEVRNRRPGDRFVPLGVGHKKKLKDFFIDEKVPRGDRDGVPIFLSDDNIFWVGGLRIDDRFKISDGTERVLFLKIEEENDSD